MNSQEWQKNSYLAGSNAPYVEELYDAYLNDPQSVDLKWQQYFSSIQSANAPTDISHEALRQMLRESARHPRVMSDVSSSVSGSGVEVLVEAYRRYGHYSAFINPLELQAPPLDSHLLPAQYGVDENAASAVILAMKTAYCGSIGFEYYHIDNDQERLWLQNQIEQVLPKTRFTADEQRKILSQLVAADSLEKYLDVKYVGQKRFSVEGVDSLIPMLRDLTEQAAKAKMNQLVFAMAHRGRLNALLNVMGRSSQKLFAEFDGVYEEGMTSGDVKYHRGFSSDVVTSSGNIHLSMMFSPSHLEFVNPVAMGSTRARQDAHGGIDVAMPVIVHGDAAFAGQGVVMETLSMSLTRAYCVGGSLHIIANNQIGFTTDDPRDTRSSYYCSDLAKMIAAPIFHVNADDPEAVIKTLRLAFAYRMTFHKDVFIDLVGYRRHGHQEVDEPRATQPLMYHIIKSRPSAMQLYADRLIKNGVISDADHKKMIADYRDLLDQGACLVPVQASTTLQERKKIWLNYGTTPWSSQVNTGVNRELLQKLAVQLTHLPEGMVLHRTIKNIVEARGAMAAGTMPLDWGFAEMLAYATLLAEGRNVRLTGEDVRRGTFYHRQMRQIDQETGQEVMPLVDIAKANKSCCSIYDSLLSEVGTVGFEYGYSTADPDSLVMWEAQFGDFANVAQVIVDQFLSSGWQKWNRVSGLVLLLPHGYEGMGPEHTSARLERYLQLCAQDNMQVCVPSTPAQMFHLLRRQVHRKHRSPLVVMTPKSLLRHKLATSALDDLAEGSFKNVFPEIDPIDPKAVTRFVACSGKIYYELLEKRRELNRHDVVIVRIEQQYPFPTDDFMNQLNLYPQVTSVVWCQEESRNQGAWFYMRDYFSDLLPKGLAFTYAGRAASAAPACGYGSLHKREQADVIDQVFSTLEK